MECCGGVVGSPGYPAGGPGVDYLAAGVGQYPPGTAVYPAAALASLAAAAAAGQHGTSPMTAGLLDQRSSAANPPTAGHCKYSLAHTLMVGRRRHFYRPIDDGCTIYKVVQKKLNDNAVCECNCS